MTCDIGADVTEHYLYLYIIYIDCDIVADVTVYITCINQRYLYRLWYWSWCDGVYHLYWPIHIIYIDCDIVADVTVYIACIDQYTLSI